MQKIRRLSQKMQRTAKKNCLRGGIPPRCRRGLKWSRSRWVTKGDYKIKVTNMPCDTCLLGHFARRYRWQQSFDPMTSPDRTFDAGQAKVRSNFEINIFTQKVHVSCPEFPQDSKYVIIFLVRCEERLISQLKKILINFSLQHYKYLFHTELGVVCGNFLLIQSDHKVL